MLLEVIAKDEKDVELINKSNASRIEFCHNLNVGGLTPDYKSISKVMDETEKPINIMIRPTARDFVYTDEEFNQMIEDIKFIKTTKANGIVIGILNVDNTIDFDRMNIVCKTAQGLDITFHKAFDLVVDKMKGISILEKLGVKSVLTSYGENIVENIDKLYELMQEANELNIIAGGGINFSNVKKIKPNVDEIHVGTAVRQNNSFDDPVSIDLINEMKKLIDEN
ncbi:copper homeostasis protein CutC [Spiroplasma endosymbiont of Labia minor]|uniref:copper homeostasis protein CutC n=1 Tax=Spiroplasma endosymbiont of Labia minor TaxID=3066305 RepID=UPI0030CDFF00